MGIMNVVAIIVGVLLVTIAAGSTSLSFRYFRCLDYDICFMSIIALMCGVAAILAGTYLK